MAHIEKRARKGGHVWRARYRSPAGAERSKSFNRKVDAERFLASVENSKAAGFYVDPSLAQLAVGEWADRWLAGQAHLKPTTFERYEGIVRTHIKPTWGRVTLANVSHAGVQAWVTDLAKESSAASVQKIHRVLSLILDMAVKDGRLARNVATGVNLPRLVKPEHLYLTHDQVEDLARECGYPSDPSRHAAYDSRSNETNRLVVLFLAYTGVRFGEMAALRVKRLDLVRRRAAIVESVTPVLGKGLVWGTPRPTDAVRCRSRRSWPTSSSSRSSARGPTSSSSRACATASRCASAPSLGRSRRRPRRSVSPGSTRTSCGTPPPASPSPPGPT